MVVGWLTIVTLNVETAWGKSHLGVLFLTVTTAWGRSRSSALWWRALENES